MAWNPFADFGKWWAELVINAFQAASTPDVAAQTHAAAEEAALQAKRDAEKAAAAAKAAAEAKLVTEKKLQLKTDYEAYITGLQKQELDASRQWTEQIQSNVERAYGGGVTGASVGAFQTEYQGRAQEVQDYLKGKEATAKTKYESAIRVVDINTDIRQTNADLQAALQDISFNAGMEDINWWLYNQNQNNANSTLDQWTGLGSKAGMSLLSYGVMTGNPWLIGGGAILAGGSTILSYTGRSNTPYTPYGG